MPATISPSGNKPKTFYGQFSISLTPMERMFLEYYARQFGRDRGDIMRGMLRKYVQLDSTFDHKDFVKWAEKEFIPEETDDTLRAMCKRHLTNYKATLPDKSGSKPAKKSSSRAGR